MLNSLGSSFHVCFHNPPSAAVNKNGGKIRKFIRHFVTPRTDFWRNFHERQLFIHNGTCFHNGFLKKFIG